MNKLRVMTEITYTGPKLQGPEVRGFTNALSMNAHQAFIGALGDNYQKVHTNTHTESHERITRYGVRRIGSGSQVFDKESDLAIATFEDYSNTPVSARELAQATADHLNAKEE